MQLEPGTRVRIIEDAKIFPEMGVRGMGGRSHLAGLEGVVSKEKVHGQYDLVVSFGYPIGSPAVMAYEVEPLPAVEYEKDGKSRFQSFQLSVKAYEDGVPIPHDWLKQVAGTPHVRLGDSTTTTASIQATPEGLDELRRRFTYRGYEQEVLGNYLTIVEVKAPDVVIE